MDAQRKQQLISEAEEKFAEKIRSLEFIKKNDNEWGPKGEDGLSVFRTKNMLAIKDRYFRPIDAAMPIGERIKQNARQKLSNVLWGFKYKADEHIGYILDVIRETEPVMLKSGKPSKNKTEEKCYDVVASYNFYSSNIEVNVLDAYYVNDFENLAYAETPEQFFNEYKRLEKEAEEKRRSQKMTITVGQWEDMLAKIDKVNNRLNELEHDLSENYERRYNSQEE